MAASAIRSLVSFEEDLDTKLHRKATDHRWIWSRTRFLLRWPRTRIRFLLWISSLHTGIVLFYYGFLLPYSCFPLRWPRTRTRFGLAQEIVYPIRRSRWILLSKLHGYSRNTNSSGSDSDANFTMTNSAMSGGIIHVSKPFSVHYPDSEMVLFADHSNGSHYCTCSSPKSVAANIIARTVKRQPSSAFGDVYGAFPDVYGAGCLPAKRQRGSLKSQIHRVQTVNRNCPSLLVVHFHKSTRKVSNIAVYSTRRHSKSTMADEAEMKLLRGIATAASADSVDGVIDSRSGVLPPATSLHHLIQTAQGSDRPRSNSAPATNSSDETRHIPAAQKLTNQESEHHSNPNPCVAEGGISGKTKRSPKWYVAAGAAHHATGDVDLFTVLQVESSDLCVHAADGTPMPVCGSGNVTGAVTLYDVWYVPGLDMNLVSVGQLAELNYSIEFARGFCTISNAADTVVGTARATGDGLYEVVSLQVSLP